MRREGRSAEWLFRAEAPDICSRNSDSSEVASQCPMSEAIWKTLKAAIREGAELLAGLWGSENQPLTA